MSNISLSSSSSCNHVNHLLKYPLCKNLHMINRVANITFHIFTLCIPLGHIALKCLSKITHYIKSKNAFPHAIKYLKPDVDKYKQNKFHYAHDLQPQIDGLFELQSIITLSKKTLQLRVDMNDEGKVEQVSSNPVFLYTDYLGPCIAAIGRCKMPDSSLLIGVTHLYPDNENFPDDLTLEASPILNDLDNLTNPNQEIIQNRLFKQQKLDRLIKQFILHPSYNSEEIEVFFAGGNGNSSDEFWCELTAEYAKSLPKVNVIGTYFNPYHATEEIQEKISNNELRLSLMAGITNHGSILLHKSHAIDFNFQESNYNALLSEL